MVLAELVEVGSSRVKLGRSFIGLAGEFVDTLLALAKPVLAPLDISAQPPRLVFRCPGLGFGLAPAFGRRRRCGGGLADDVRGLEVGLGLKPGRVVISVSLQPSRLGVGQARRLRARRSRCRDTAGSAQQHDQDDQSTNRGQATNCHQCNYSAVATQDRPSPPGPRASLADSRHTCLQRGVLPEQRMLGAAQYGPPISTAVSLVAEHFR